MPQYAQSRKEGYLNSQIAQICCPLRVSPATAPSASLAAPAAPAAPGSASEPKDYNSHDSVDYNGDDVTAHAPQRRDVSPELWPWTALRKTFPQPLRQSRDATRRIFCLKMAEAPRQAVKDQISARRFLKARRDRSCASGRKTLLSARK
ncbi:hypothetical protein SRHO_G00176950 [Serrasalmus rhombeus]